jgi:hypothetical protein
VPDSESELSGALRRLPEPIVASKPLSLTVQIGVAEENFTAGHTLVTTIKCHDNQNLFTITISGTFLGAPNHTISGVDGDHDR